jgi:murein peptide amidase A
VPVETSELRKDQYASAKIKADVKRGVLESLDQLCARNESLLRSPLRLEKSDHELPRYILLGPKGGGDPVRIGVFAGIHGDEPAGVEAVALLAERLFEKAEIAEGYHLFFYPACNPSGLAMGSRLSASGKDLNREFWRNSSEPEVQLLEAEIREHRFQGLISLHADDTSDGMYGFVRGAVLTKNLLEPALAAAEQILPRNRHPIIDGFAAHEGIISECYDGILTSPPKWDQNPFEIILESPQSALRERQAQALALSVEVVLVEYQKLIAFAANL